MKKNDQGLSDPKRYDHYQKSHHPEYRDKSLKKDYNHVVDTHGCKLYSVRHSGDKTPHARVPGFSGQTKGVVEGVKYQETGLKQKGKDGAGHCMLTGVKKEKIFEPAHFDSLVKKNVTMENGKTKTRYVDRFGHVYSQVSSSVSGQVRSGPGYNFPPRSYEKERDDHTRRWHHVNHGRGKDNQEKMYGRPSTYATSDIAKKGKKK